MKPSTGFQIERAKLIAGFCLTAIILAAPLRAEIIFEKVSPYHHVQVIDDNGTRMLSFNGTRETMSSERVYPPIPRGAPGGYYLENVLYTQYFATNGAAIHYNYWSSNWGYPGSHGCLGLPLAEAKWAWDWATLGTPVQVFG